MENGDIPDANIEASHSLNDSKYGPQQARLNGQGKPWRVSGSVSSPWIQVDIGYSTSVSGLLTQGYENDNGVGRWITKLKVSSFTAANVPEVFIKDENGVDKVFIRL